MTLREDQWSLPLNNCSSCLFQLGIHEKVRLIWNFTLSEKNNIFVSIISETLQCKHRVTILGIKSFWCQEWASFINSLMFGEWEKGNSASWNCYFPLSLVSWVTGEKKNKKHFFLKLYFQLIQIASQHFWSSPVYSTSYYCGPMM